VLGVVTIPSTCDDAEQGKSSGSPTVAPPLFADVGDDSIEVRRPAVAQQVCGAAMRSDLTQLELRAVMGSDIARRTGIARPT
jgi:hypothetical protein